MFAPKVNTYVDKEIARVIVEMQDLSVMTQEYATALERLGKLQKIREDEKPDRASTDTLVKATANLIGIAMIIRYENLNVIASKALAFIR